MTESVHAKDITTVGRVGIFWFYKGRLLARTQPLSLAEERGGKLDSPLAHVDEWPGLVAHLCGNIPLSRILDYEEVPRGRYAEYETEKSRTAYIPL